MCVCVCVCVCVCEALHIMKFDMQQLLSASEYVAQSADRSVIPDIHYASR